MPDDHPHHVALSLAQVFGGPPRYTDELGGYPRMMGKHIGLALTEAQRSRWVALIGLAADDVSLAGARSSAPRSWPTWSRARGSRWPTRSRAPSRRRSAPSAAMGLGRGAAVLAQPWLRRRRSSSFSTRSRAAPATANAIRAVTKAREDHEPDGDGGDRVLRGVAEGEDEHQRLNRTRNGGCRPPEPAPQGRRGSACRAQKHSTA